MILRPCDGAPSAPDERAPARSNDPLRFDHHRCRGVGRAQFVGGDEDERRRHCLAVKCGEQATAYIREHGTTVSIAAAAVLAVGFGICTVWRRRGRRHPKADRI